MKKFPIVLTTILSVFFLSSCTKGNATITGTITEIRENSVTILTDDFKKDNGEQAQGDLNFSWEEEEKLKVGDRIKIQIKGPVRESFPVQADVTKVEMLSK